MSNKEYKTRLQLKNDTPEIWEKVSDPSQVENVFIPVLGEPFLYKKEDGDGYQFDLKIGDGVRTPKDLPKFNEQIQSDWNQEDASAADYILNKPKLGDLASKSTIEKTDFATDVQEYFVELEEADKTLSERIDGNTNLITAETERASAAEQKINDEKLDKTGGTVDGPLVVTGDLTVHGKTISEDHETIVVEDNMVILNSNKVDLQTAVSGLAINKDESSTYAAVYDPIDDTFKFGEGALDENNEFAFNEGEGLPFAVRDDSTQFADGHIVQWSEDGNKLVDSGKSVTDYVEKVQGKGLSTEDFTTAEKNKLGGIAENANNYVLPSAGTALGGVKSGGDATIKDGVITVNQLAKHSEAIIDDTVAYTKNVPENSASYAKIDKIGGMTRKCANLLDTSIDRVTRGGLTFESLTNGRIKVTGTKLGANVVTVKFFDNFVLPVGTYTFSAKLVSGSYSSVDNIVRAGLNGDLYMCLLGQSKTFEITEPLSITNFSLVVYNDNGVFSNVEIEFMLNPGSTALPYEPYFGGLRPAPITKFESTGINILSENSIETGVYWEYDQNTLQLYKKTQPSGSTMLLASTPIRIKPNTTYYISSTNSAVQWAVWFANETGKVFSRTTNWISANNTFTTPPYDCYGYFTAYYSGSSYQNDIVITEGLTAAKDTLSVPAAVQGLDDYGHGVNKQFNNYIEFKDDGKKYYHHVVKHIVFDGVSDGKKMDGTDAQDAGKNSYYAYMVSETLGVLWQTPTVSYGDVIFATNTVLSVSVKTSELGLNNAPTQAEITNAINTYLHNRYSEGNPVEVVCILSNPTVEDITDKMQLDNILQVEAGGTIICANDYQDDAYSKIIFYNNNHEAISANAFTGNLIGTASCAIADGEGKNIADTYATKEEIKDAGIGDMLKSVYATNGATGVVDKAVSATQDGNGNSITDTYVAKEHSGTALITTTYADTPLSLYSKASESSVYLGFKDKNATDIGYLGVSNGKPVFYNTKNNEIITSATIGDQTVKHSTSASNADTLTQHSISAAPTGKSTSITVGTKFTAGGIEFPAYAKGLYSSAGTSDSDAILLTVDVNGHINTAYRNGNTWQNGRTMLDSNNYTTYVPKKDGTGAAGTWGINITGNSTTANSATLLKPNNATTEGDKVTDVHANRWTAAWSGKGIEVWGQDFRNDAVGTDTGAISLWLSSGGTSNPAQLNMTIDGEYYATGSQHKVLHAGNYSSYALPLSGGTMFGPITLKSGSTAAYDKTALSFVSSNLGTEHARIGTDSSGGLGVYSIGDIFIRAKVTLGEGTSNGLKLSGNNSTLTGSGDTGVLNIDNSSNRNSWIYFQTEGVNKASTGYFEGMAFIANEKTYARIGVNDEGIPQYWSDTDPKKAQTLIHSGNIGNQSVAYAASAGSAPASDVYAWAKASTKPSYSWDEIGSKPSTFTPSSHTHNYAGSSSVGGPATTALECTGNAATATTASSCTGNAATATATTLLKPATGVANYRTSTWESNVGTSNSTTKHRVWGEAFGRTSSEDTGDIVLWLQDNGTSASNRIQLNMTIDGDYYATSNCYRVLHEKDYIRAGLASGSTAGLQATAEGYNTKPLGSYAHTEGSDTTVVSTASCGHAEGYKTTVNGSYAHASGISTNANENQFVIGHYNQSKAQTSTSGNTTGTAFVIGAGTSSTSNNALRVDYNGKVYAGVVTGEYISGGADYAEYFEWADANLDNEDRCGYFVTMDGEKIRIATANDYILGIVSAHPAVLGNGDEDWMGRYIRDEFGRGIIEEFEYEEEIPEEVTEVIEKEIQEEVTDEETGEVTIETKIVPETVTKVVINKVAKTGTRYKENPDYDPSKPYIQREDRPEWDAVGMMGVLSVRDDGTCKVNGYCKVTDEGTATAADTGYRVIARVNDHIVKVIFK